MNIEDYYTIINTPKENDEILFLLKDEKKEIVFGWLPCDWDKVHKSKLGWILFDSSSNKHYLDYDNFISLLKDKNLNYEIY